METILSSDRMPEFIRSEIQDYWPIEREMLAVLVEQMDTLISITYKAYGGKRERKPIKVPRPNSVREQAQDEAISMGQLTRKIRAGQV